MRAKEQLMEHPEQSPNPVAPIIDEEELGRRILRTLDETESPLDEASLVRILEDPKDPLSFVQVEQKIGAMVGRGTLARHAGTIVLS